jgi:hypothetical protein
MKPNHILYFINSLRKTDLYILPIFVQGGCYQFYILLSKIFNGCEPYINSDKNHVVTKYKGKFYDINGIVSGSFYPLSEEDVKMCKKWSFARNYLLQIKECPNCEEPIIYS